MATARAARDRVRLEIRNEILEAAKKRLSQDGPVALSLRSIARDLEIAPSALYRYFDGRDALLTALIQSAYESLADAAEAASSSYGQDDSYLARWSAVPRAMRVWALSNPNEWGLIFGSPVPGYVAPETTVVPYARLATALVLPLNDAAKAGALQSHPDADVDAALGPALAPISEGVFDRLTLSTVAAAVRAWATLIGLIDLEVFGHWRNTVLDPALFFDDSVRRVGLSIGLR
jgi:AcrR family transcriptional regulator